MLLIDVFLICSCFPQLLNSNPSKLGFQGFFSSSSCVLFHFHNFLTGSLD